ncbi:hypothetical protein [Neobacillus sp. PS3-40]|uniref:hypothetical protein n=1 Tax=Neobacillus sp. PS3-40 TaxID=3070679 RepID=UPI0027E0A80A|nr:hypothetical protein [Neobacillus sp. PS3-40]WML45459.1 hypothetical protein RCG20_06030 [Neobacillus sp. PS3-40]
MNKLFTVLAFLCVLTIGQSFQAHALMFDHLPKSQTSKQWLVQIDKTKDDKDSVKPQKGVFDTYSFNVRNIGHNVDFVKVQAFRDAPNSKTKFALFSENKPTSVMIEKKGQNFNFSVFPLWVKAKELEIVVTWKEKGIDRELKETFLFKQ